MTQQRCPHNRGKCPFYVVPEDPLSAKASIGQCVACVIANNGQLEGLREDLYQLALLTILEETPNYDPAHPSGASYTTFMKACVCTRLWSERRKELRYHPFSHEDPVGDTEPCERNLLVSRLIAEACERESEADKVIRHLEVEVLRKHLLQILSKLSDKERRVIEMKYFEDFTGIKIAQVLAISEGRVSQLTKNALKKIGKAYLVAVEKDYRTTYRKT